MRLIAVILPYAVSIRDFLHAGVLHELLEIPDVRIHIYTQNSELPEFDTIRSSRVLITEIKPHVERRLEGMLKRVYPVLFYDTFVHVQHAVDRSAPRRTVAKALVGLRRALGTQRTLRIYAWLLKLLSSGGEQLIEGRPDLLISTRSLVRSLDYALMLEAAVRRIPQITAASSWDNFTTKGFFPFPVLKTIVWNRQMADELEQIFDVAPMEIVVAGYPRLRLLQNSGPIDEAAAYLASLGLGEYKRFILYSASYSELTRSVAGDPPKEYQLVRDVATALAPTLPDDTCILVRLHPYSLPDDEGFFDTVPRAHVFVPGRQDRYVERVMNSDDEMHLSAQLKFSECVISMASTMTIDALALGRPIINVAFDPASGGDKIRRFYEFNHFRDLLRAVKPPMARDTADVIAFVDRCMAGDRDPRIDRAAFEALYVPADSLDYPLRVRATAEDVLGRAPSPAETEPDDADRRLTTASPAR